MRFGFAHHVAPENRVGFLGEVALHEFHMSAGKLAVKWSLHRAKKNRCSIGKRIHDPPSFLFMPFLRRLVPVTAHRDHAGPEAHNRT
jgi:hypothetical protein